MDKEDEVRQAIIDAFKPVDRPKLTVSGGLLFNPAGKPDGAEVEIEWNEQREGAERE